MVDPLYPRLRVNVAQKLIRKYGKPVIVLKPGARTGPDHNPVEGPPTEIRAKFAETGYDIRNRNETLIQAGDKVGVLEPAAEIELSWKIVIDGRTYSLKDVKPLNPGGLNLLTEIVAG